jgi:hypothetical protein
MPPFAAFPDRFFLAYPFNEIPEIPKRLRISNFHNDRIRNK